MEGARSRSRRRPRGGDGHLGGLSGAVPPAHAPRNRRAPLGDAGARRGAQREQRQRCARWALGYVGVDVARESKGPLCAVPRHSSRRRLIGGATAFCKHRRRVGAAVRFEARAGRRPRGRGTRLPWQTAGKLFEPARRTICGIWRAVALCAWPWYTQSPTIVLEALASLKRGCGVGQNSQQAESAARVGLVAPCAHPVLAGVWRVYLCCECAADMPSARRQSDGRRRRGDALQRGNRIAKVRGPAAPRAAPACIRRAWQPRLAWHPRAVHQGACARREERGVVTRRKLVVEGRRVTLCFARARGVAASDRPSDSATPKGYAARLTRPNAVRPCLT